MANMPGHWMLYVVCFSEDFGVERLPGFGSSYERWFLEEGRLIECIVAMQTFAPAGWVDRVEFELEDYNFYDADGGNLTEMPRSLRVYTAI